MRFLAFIVCWRPRRTGRPVCIMFLPATARMIGQLLFYVPIIAKTKKFVYRKDAG
ncbi:hypothetical protein HMPREF1548_05586 [Clostridium sp. KLE 1755]|nr:hypothetical protein HMPREF1548_05586 [Clostridium sp. KLE 1755]